MSNAPVNPNDPQARLAALADAHEVSIDPSQPSDFWALAYAVAAKLEVDPMQLEPGNGRAWLDALEQAGGSRRSSTTGAQGAQGAQGADAADESSSSPSSSSSSKSK